MSDVTTPSQRSFCNATLIILSCFLAMANSTIANIAVSISLPDIMKDLNIDVNKLQWITSAYALSGACFLLLFGRFADIYGRKLVLLVGAAWSTIFALSCGFAKSEVQLFILRGMQGLGTAATIPAAIGILAHSFPPSRQRSMAFAIFSTGNPFGGGIGLALGGIVTQFAATRWRGTLFLVSGLGAISFIISALSIDRDVSTEEKDARIDWIGAALVTSGLILITFVLGQGPVVTNGFRTPYLIGLLIVGVFMILSFVAWEHYLVKRTTMPPLMRPELWTRGKGKFSAMQGIAFLEMGAFTSWILWTQLYYQTYKDYTPVQAMVRFLPMIVTGFILNIIVGFVVGLIDVLWLLVIGTLSTGGACLLLSLIDPNAVYWAFGFPAAILSVGGADFIFASGSIFVARVAHPHEQSVAGGLFQAVIQTGVAFGLAITTIVHNDVFMRDIARDSIVISDINSNAPTTAALNAFKAAQWTAFGFAMAALVLAIVFLRGVGIVGDRRIRRDERLDSSMPGMLLVVTPSSVPSATEKNSAVLRQDDKIQPANGHTREVGENGSA